MCDKVAVQSKGKFVLLESLDRIDRENFENLYMEALDR